MQRPSLTDYFLIMAHAAAKRSSCLDKQVGCVLVNSDNHVVGIGYNGTPSGMYNCCDVGKCQKDEGAQCFAIHAEANAIRHATGAPVRAYCTLEPCKACAKLLSAVGVKEVFFAHRTNKDKSGWLEFKGSWIHYPCETSGNVLNGIRKYHKALGYPKPGNGSSNLTPLQLRQGRDLCLAAIDELTEVLHSFDWKPWKKYDGAPQLRDENFLEEVGDVLFFLDSLLMNFGFSWEELLKRTSAKIDENYRRIATGYHN